MMLVSSTIQFPLFDNLAVEMYTLPLTLAIPIPSWLQLLIQTVLAVDMCIHLNRDLP